MFRRLMLLIVFLLPFTARAGEMEVVHQYASCITALRVTTFSPYANSAKGEELANKVSQDLDKYILSVSKNSPKKAYELRKFSSETSMEYYKIYEQALNQGASSDGVTQLAMREVERSCRALPR